jgi:hypothetical protein
MPWWHLSADTLADSRFVVSALAEVLATLKSLRRPTHPADEPWAAPHRPAFHALLAEDPITALLLSHALRPRWNAEYLTPVPDGAPFDTELARLRDTPPETVRAHLSAPADAPLPDTRLPGSPLPAALHRDDLAARTADLLAWVWRTCVRDDWPRRRRVIEADTVARTAKLTKAGWSSAIDGMRPGMRWMGEGKLRIHTRDLPPLTLGHAHLVFVPVTPRQSWLSWDRHGYAITYPCSGVLADTPTPPGPLTRLLGPGRAAVLALLDTPKSTTHLVAITGQALGSVGGHLKVLLDSGLVARRRAGRSVLYYRTELGELLVGG